MKLRNKKTGEIGYLQNDTLIKRLRVVNVNNDTVIEYSTLAELNEEWEDYEEPKGTALYWTILTLENFIENEPDDKWVDLEDCKQVLEKLKAWKRLKDKGLKFNKWTIPEEPKTPHIKLVIEAEMDVPDSPYDLDLLFGGED